MSTPQGGDVWPLPPLMQTEGLRRLLQDAAWRQALQAKLEALGLNLEELTLEP